jgi:NACalpha-BTF3-like transcription factor
VLSKINDADEVAAKAKAQREAELAKIVVKQQDIDFLVQELELDKNVADRALREHNNNLVAATKSFL